MSDKPLRAPFPWFGGKSRAASLIWSRLGNPANYVEPFAGSLAVLLARPHEPGTETVNDLDCYVANFWRAVAHAPDDVAQWCDWPVNEADLHARHRWLIEVMPWHRERIMTDPDYFDAKIAGWWVWGLCQWIGTGWCERDAVQLPQLSHPGSGVHSMNPPNLAQIAHRLRRVRVTCGQWDRILGTSTLNPNNVIGGVVLDPPYYEGNVTYSAGNCVSADVAKWAIENGGNPMLRIVLCGYEGEHVMPDDWECVPWKAKGGYGSQRKNGTNDNAHRERLWFSPHCLKPNRHDDLPLFKETT